MDLKFLMDKPTVGVLATTVRCDRCGRTHRVRTMHPGQGELRCCGR